MFLIGKFFAIMTFQRNRFVFYDREFRAYAFVIGNTFGIDTTYDALHRFRNFYRFFLDHLIVSYDIDMSGRCDEGKLVDFIVFQELVPYFDNRFFPQLPAVQISPESHGMFQTFESEHIDDIKQFIRRDMVDNRTIIDGAYLQLFF